MKTIITFLLLFATSYLQAQDLQVSANYTPNDSTVTIHLKNISSDELVIWNSRGFDIELESHVALTLKSKMSQKKHPIYNIYCKLGGSKSTKFTDKIPIVCLKPGEEDTWIYKLSEFMQNSTLISGDIKIIYGYFVDNRMSVEKVKPSFTYRFSIP